MPKRPARTKARSLLSPVMKPIGILGGGQLARMMALKSHEMGLPISILSEKTDDPAAQVAQKWVQGKLDDSKTLEAFLRSCSVVTFESEFLDAELLERLEKRTGTPILPRPQDMRLIQDRLSQKVLLNDANLPTAKFVMVNSAEEAANAFAKLGGEVVFKKRRFGYDGYGTFVVRTPKALKSFLASFDTIPGREFGFIAELFVPFKRELAVMVARSTTGQTLHLPFVETFQQNSRCLWVKGPEKPTATLTALGRRLESFLSKIGYVGIMGVELFETSNGLLINELAPRVHNSGHYSLDALLDDQFTLHLKAITGSEIRKPISLSKAFAMYNLLGSSSTEPTWKLAHDVKLHWYGKVENRKGRKMGHVNALGATPQAALSLLKKRVGKDFNV